MNHASQNTTSSSSTSSDSINQRKRMRRGYGTKGKRVHLCSELLENSSTCNQTFSRAEHLRRHISRVHPPRDVAQDAAALWKGHAAPDQSQALVASSLHIPQLHIPPTRSIEEAELLYYWTILYSSEEVQRYVKEESEWALSYVPKMCERDDAIRGTVLSIAASQMAHTGALTRYRSYMSQFGYHGALEQVRQGIDEVAALTGPTQVSIDRLEQLLVSSYLLAIRIQISNTDTASSSATSPEKLQALILRFNAVRGFYGLLQRINMICPAIIHTEFWRLVVDVQRRDAGLMDALSPTMPQASPSTFRHFDALLANLDQDESASSTNTVYRSSITILEWVYDATILAGSSVMATARWRFMFCLLPGELVALLSAHDSRALAILAHCVCLETSPNLTSTWWMAQHIAPMVQALADLIHPDWAWAVEWPLKVAQGKTDMRSSPVLQYEAHEKRLRDLRKQKRRRASDRKS